MYNALQRGIFRSGARKWLVRPATEKTTPVRARFASSGGSAERSALGLRIAACALSGAAGFVCASRCEGSKQDRRISLDELREFDQGCWVSYKGGVYDVTEFLDAHPGGPHRIMMVSGQDLGPFWQVYDLHRQRPHILKLLEKYRVGSLSPEDARRSERESSFASAYTDDPDRPRKSELHVPSEHPWNHEPALSALVDSFYTPNDLFFVRNHV